MSVALMIKEIDGQESDRYIPIAGEKLFLNYWEPVIETEGFVWLSLIQPGLWFTEEDLPAIVKELQDLQQAVPRYYQPDTTAYQQMEERLTNVLAELAELKDKRVKLYIG